jgi:hypothetical protein
MKAGRPTYHVQAKWITVNLPNRVLYFELDGKGNLVNGTSTTHHVRPERSLNLDIAERLRSQIPNAAMPSPPENSVFTEPELTGCFSEDWDTFEFDPFPPL